MSFVVIPITARILQRQRVQRGDAFLELEVHVVAAQAGLEQLARAVDARQHVAQRGDRAAAGGQAHQRTRQREDAVVDARGDARRALHEGRGLSEENTAWIS